MSSSSFDKPCPNCEEDMSVTQDNRPFNKESAQCLHCGFYYMTVSGFDDLETINEGRKEYTNDLRDPDDYIDGISSGSLPPLVKLPAQDMDLCNRFKVKATYIKDVDVEIRQGSNTVLQVYEDPQSRGIFAVDASYLEQVSEEITSPFNFMTTLLLREPSEVS